MLEPSTVNRPLQVRCRADLVATPVEVAGAHTWMVKDPLALEHSHLTDEEYFLLGLLREPISLSELRRQYERRFAPARISPEMIWHFIHRAHESGLVLSNAAGQGEELLRRAGEDRFRQWTQWWMQLLAIRCPGINPDAWLTALHRRGRWLVSPVTLALAVGVVLYALGLVVGNFGEFCARLPGLSALADWRNLIWLMSALAVVKILHELAHALTCKHFGGEVHEMGLMLLAFTPCLYCDVSDAWRLPNRWHRITITAAGVLVEILLAAVAIIVWWYSRPGVVHLVALNVVIVCTISTLIVNGNPLLRYDAYYILSDLAESPNLWHRSRQALRDLAGKWVLGLKARADVMIPRRHRPWLVMYGLASKVYLTMVVIGIVWMLVQFMYPLHLQNVAYGVGMLVLGSCMIGPAHSTAKLLRNPLRRREMRAGRPAVIVVSFVAAAVAVLAWPVPYPVKAPAVLLPENAHRVYATVGGKLVEAAQAGSKLAGGQILARLENAERQRELVRLEGEQRLLELRLDHLNALRSTDSNAGDQIPTTQAALATVESQIDDRQREAGRLQLTAPVAGTLLPVPSRQRPSASTHALSNWFGSVLDDENHSAWVEPGTLICWIGDPHRLEAVLLVSDSEAQRVRTGQLVHVALDQLPTTIVLGQVVEVARRTATAAGRGPRTVGDPVDRLLQRLSPPGRESSRFQVRVRLEAVDQPLVAGGRGQAKINTSPMTIGGRLWRNLLHTFRVPL